MENIYHSSGEIVTIKPRKLYSFDPKLDITAYELALCVKLMFAANFYDITDDMIAFKVERHFKEEKRI